ncbi:M14 family metallopeptidase [Marinobacterium aestuariivivens]|uniref:M14-type cytosolic carboxypeptidase n=1 Tax=Marinobacterium aestuariivivens TaxID=1698799 RepID=A0ABW1ZWA2_9GAMM
MSGIHISAQFDSGNIEVVDAGKPDDIQLRIRQDSGSEFYQWFHFRVQGARDQALRLRLLNAAGASYPDGWDDYRAVASYDRKHWFRVPTRYDGSELVIEHTPAQDSLYYACFAPYSFERHLDLIARAGQSERVRIERLGETLDGRDFDMLRIGEPAEGRRTLWVTARQHPGESMAQWCAEGLIERLLDRHDAQAARILEEAVIYLVPNMNPDGAVRGHLRTNALGVNLNREWDSPSLERSPEVYCVRRRMEETGVNLYLDLHGDEGLPCNFIAGQEGLPWAPEALLEQERQFERDLAAANADFQLERGYPIGKFVPEEAITLASNWVGKRFQCPAMTLEMPFKDYDLRPDPLQGWSPERSARLGASLLDPILAWLGRRS